MGGLYNVVQGMNQLAPVLLGFLGFKKVSDVGRFRDAFVSNGRIAVYTRNGGGNRECRHYEEIPTAPGRGDCGHEDCYGCVITHRLPKHPLYIEDKDDHFDSTYATVYFKIPTELRAELEPFDIGEFDPDARWQQAIQRIDRGEFNPAEQQLAEKLQNLFSKLPKKD